MPSVIATWRALVTPRRAVPLGAVLLAVVSAEWIATRSGIAIAIDLGLFTAFALLVPASFRLLGRSPLGLWAYAALCALIVLGAGAGPAALGLGWTYVVDPTSLGLLWILFAVGGWGLGRDLELEEGFAAERERALRMTESAERASLLALRANLDPHFLFNTLNAIAEWCREDPAVAEQATLRLASMLRAMLEGIRSASWPLATEMAIARSLFELHAIRDRARYRFRIDAPDPMPDVPLPPMIFLPLFENAITHGPGAGHEGEIVVRLRVEDGVVRLEIDNPGAFTGRREGGEGIAMVEKRLALAYGGRAELSLRGEAGRTQARVTLRGAPGEGPA
ncbi:MAG: histidine kinase [Sandaracinaceae bacterium]|nr:histidine kinase [Sandaracinaceae bacterium]